MEDGNRSSNPSIHDVSDPARRTLLRGGLAGGITGLLAPLSGVAALAGCASTADAGAGPLLGFKSVPVSVADTVSVPAGYSVQALAAWGEPAGLSGESAAFKFDGSNSAAEQETQLGHAPRRHPLLQAPAGPRQQHQRPAGDEPRVHRRRPAACGRHGDLERRESAQGTGGARRVGDRSRVQGRPVGHRAPQPVGAPHHGQHAHELRRSGRRPCAAADRGRPERHAACWARSTTAPAASRPGAPTSPAKRTSSATSAAATRPTPHEQRWGLRKGGSGYRWHEHDERFDAVKHPNEPNRFGWVVEIDPYNPSSTPVKRTALGRAAHEGATVGGHQGRPRRRLHGRGRALRVHLQVRQPRQRSSPAASASQRDAAGPRHALRRPLRRRRQAAAGSRWCTARAPLTAANGFADQGEVLIKTRQASDLLGATKMDRPEWIAVDQQTAGSTARSPTTAAAAPTSSPAWTRPTRAPTTPWATSSAGRKTATSTAPPSAGTTSCWPATRPTSAPRPRATSRATPSAAPTACGSTPAACCGSRPTCRPRPWARAICARLGNNAMLAADPRTGEIRRFLTGPGGLRDHRRHRHARRPHDVHQHPAPGRKPERAQRPGRAAPCLQLARQQTRRPAALGHGGDPQERWRRDRQLSPKGHGETAAP